VTKGFSSSFLNTTSPAVAAYLVDTNTQSKHERLTTEEIEPRSFLAAIEFTVNPTVSATRRAAPPKRDSGALLIDWAKVDVGADVGRGHSLPRHCHEPPSR